MVLKRTNVQEMYIFFNPTTNIGDDLMSSKTNIRTTSKFERIKDTIFEKSIKGVEEIESENKFFYGSMKYLCIFKVLYHLNLLIAIKLL